MIPASLSEISRLQNQTFPWSFGGWLFAAGVSGRSISAAESRLWSTHGCPRRLSLREPYTFPSAESLFRPLSAGNASTSPPALAPCMAPPLRVPPLTRMSSPLLASVHCISHISHLPALPTNVVHCLNMCLHFIYNQRGKL